MARATFYKHQTSGACAGLCTCDRTHQMEKIESYLINRKQIVIIGNILLGEKYNMCSAL